MLGVLVAGLVVGSNGSGDGRERNAYGGRISISGGLGQITVKRGVRRKIITPLDTPQAFADESAQEYEARAAAQDSALVRALGMAHHWQRLLDDGRFTSMTEITQAEGLNPGRASTLTRLMHLAPDVVEACLTDDSGIALEHLIRNGSLPLDWQQQRRMIQARS
ncbi:MAG: LacI family transcriptional regulator [Burkholderiaceae bacterium]|nr:LacI family transcriptional regulator [Burkholderiaceae bacterium]